MSDSEPHEFVCRDCGCHVYSFVARPDHRCLTCGIIADLPEEAGRNELRIALYDSDQLQHWKRFGCYRDDTFPERDCNSCGSRYRGPAVYCSLDCAAVDGAPIA